MEGIKSNNLINLTAVGNATLPDIGCVAFLMANLATYLPYTIMYAAASVFGLLDNTLIIATIILNKELHSTTNMLVFNLSLVRFFN